MMYRIMLYDILDEVACLNEQRLYMSRIGSSELLQSMLLYDVMVFIYGTHGPDP
uniref:Uncharacterized protein n=1 Tax=Helianthus annuus TaxID=4232 RepID=A0A251U4J6_HELAN